MNPSSLLLRYSGKASVSPLPLVVSPYNIHPASRQPAVLGVKDGIRKFCANKKMQIFSNL